VQFKWEFGGNNVYLVLLQDEDRFVSKERMEKTANEFGQRIFQVTLVSLKFS
jgi:hypothetical protein